MENAHQHVEQVHEQKDAAASGGDAGEQSRRPSYGATGLPVHGRASAQGRRVPRRTGGSGHPRLSDVPEGDEGTDEGWERDHRSGARGGRSILSTVPPRMFFSVLALPVLAPLVVLGPRLGKDALVVPAAIPAHRWSTTSAGPNLVKGAHLAQISQHGLKKLSAQQVQLDAKDLGKAVSEAVAKGGGEDLLRTFGTVVKDDDDAMVIGPAGPEAARMQQTQQGPEIIRAGRTSIWNYGPFVFTLGVMVSILVKMLIAQPLAKVGTDMLLLWAGTQEQAQDSEQYYGYVYLERDEEFGGPTPRSNSSQRARNSTPAVNSSRTLASEAVTPRRQSLGDANMSRGSVDSKRSSSGKKKWPVTLDLPDHGATFGASHPQQAPAATNGAAETPLPVLSPESALTSPGETLISDLDVSTGLGAQV